MTLFLLTHYVVGDFQIPALSSYLTTLYTSFIVTLLKLYVIEPVNDDGWVIPPETFAPGIALPKTDTRVYIRSREYDIDGKEVLKKSTSANNEE